MVRYDDFKTLRLSCSGLSTGFYMMAFKRRMTDLEWYGNTAYDTKSGFLYLISPNQVYKWDVDEPWEGYHIMVSPKVLQDYNIDFSFFKYQISEALFLTESEQTHIETLYDQIFSEYENDNYDLDLLMAYCNLIFTYIGKCYQRQFKTRQPLYNAAIVEFKKLLNNFYTHNPNALPSVHYFAQKLDLFTNYFGDVVKHNTGKTASEWIQEKIISDAKRHLKLNHKTIAEIGYDLGFEYATYFGQFFKKHTGMTPSAFRRHIQKTLKPL